MQYVLWNGFFSKFNLYLSTFVIKEYLPTWKILIKSHPSMCVILSNLSRTFDINGPNSLSKAQRKEGTKGVFSLIYIANAYGFAVCTFPKISVYVSQKHYAIFFCSIQSSLA